MTVAELEALLAGSTLVGTCGYVAGLVEAARNVKQFHFGMNFVDAAQ